MRVMQPKDFNIGDNEAGTLDVRNHLGQRRRITAREYVLVRPAIGRAGSVGAADGMEKRNPIGIEPIPHHIEEAPIMGQPHMLEHSHRHDPVECLGDVTVVLQAELDPIAGIFRQRTGLGDFDLAFRQADAHDLHAVGSAEKQRKTAPPAADVEYSLTRTKAQLFADERHFL